MIGRLPYNYKFIVRTLNAGIALILAMVSILTPLSVTALPIKADDSTLPVDRDTPYTMQETPHSPTADLTIILSADTGMEDPATVYNGERVTFTITLDNQHPVTITNVHANVSLSRNTLDEITCLDTVGLLQSATYTCEMETESHSFLEPSGGAIVVTSTSKLKWSILPLAADERITLTFSARVIGQPDGADFSYSASAYYYIESDYYTVNSDILTLSARVRVQEGGASISEVPTWFSNDVGGTISQDWGDFDQDGYLDLALGSSLGASVYRNEAGRLTHVWTSPPDGPSDYRLSYGVRWADVDHVQEPQQLELIVVGDSEDDSATAPSINYIYSYDQSSDEFIQTTVFTSPYQLVRLEPGDYDGDGDVDLVVSTNAINVPCPVNLYRNDGSGHFTGTVAGAVDHHVECLSQYATAAISPADYDGDGDLDLSLGVFPGTLRILTNLSNGGVITDANPFDTENPIDVETGLEYIPYDLAWGDYNQDGYLDLAAAYPLQREARVYKNQSGVTLSPIPQSFHTVPFMTPLAVDWADSNGDGQLDLVVADSPPRIYEHLEGTDTFALSVASLSLPLNRGQIWSLRSVDLNNRGNMDLIMSNRDGASHIFTTLAPRLEPTITPVGTRGANSVAWGDYNGDGSLDLLLGAPLGESDSELYLNQGGDLSEKRPFRHSGYGPHVVAFGDVTGDGQLDIALGIPNGIQIYYDGNSDNAPDWQLDTDDNVLSLAWGDADDDGQLDLLVGFRHGLVQLYLNQGAQLDSSPAFTAVVAGDANSLAWGDYDNDVYLDFVVGVQDGPVQLFRNNGGLLHFSQTWSFEQVWSSPDAFDTTAVDWADYDNDGDLDLAVGNYGADDQVWENDGGAFATSPAWSSSTSLSNTTSLAWGDWDNDGYPELAVGRDNAPDIVYANLDSEPGSPYLVALWNSSSQATTGLAWGDRDGDGDMDLGVSREGVGEQSGFYENTLVAPAHLPGATTWATPLPNNPSYVYIERPGITGDAYFYSSPETLAAPGLAQRTVSITYKLYDPEADVAARTYFEYSLDGGSRWKTATPATGSNDPLTRTSLAGQVGTFAWDAVSDDAISDNARFRIRLVPQFSVGPVQRGANIATSPPFRVRALDCYWPTGASITTNITDPHVSLNETIQFTAEIESYSGSINYYWDFDDGGTGTGKNVAHSYSRNGTFIATLHASGAACPIARPAYAMAAIIAGTGVPDKIIYLPLVLKSASAKMVHQETDTLIKRTNAGRPTNLPIHQSTNLPTYQPTNSPPRRPASTTGAGRATQVTNFSLGVNSQPAVNGDGSRIAFWSTWSTGSGNIQNPDGNIEVFLAEVQSDGTVTYTQVTSSTGSILGGFNLYPSIDKAGERIAFFSDRDLVGQNLDRNFEVFFAEINSGAAPTLTQVTETPKGINMLPDISGDGRFVAFVSNQEIVPGGNPNRVLEIFRAEILPSGQVTFTQITHSTDEVNDQPAINEDGRFIAFVSTQNGSRQIVLAEIAPTGETTHTQITSSGGTSQLPSVSELPSISADGVRIAFISDQNLDTDDPVGNPNGVRQVFLASVLTATTPYTVEIDQITHGGENKNQPAINADGTRIAYILIDALNDRRLHLYDIIDKDEVDTDAGNDNAHPSFNTDGTTVAFVSNWNVLLRDYPLTDLAISKSANPDEAIVDDLLTYTLVVTNNGPNPATDVKVTDFLPLGVESRFPLELADYVDDDNDILDGFGAGTNYGTDWNAGNQWLEISTFINPFDLPDDGGDTDTWIDMSGNVLLLHLDENPASHGATIANTSGHVNDGTLNTSDGTANKSVDGKLGRALQFDGVNDYVVVNRPVASDFSIAFWLKSSQVVGSDGHWWSGRGLVDGEVAGSMNDFGVSLLNGKVHFGVGNPDVTIRSRFVADGTWHHVVATRIRSTGVIKLYVNGRKVASSTGSTSFLTAPAQLRIGSIQTGINFFEGLIDEVAIFNRSLTDDEIQAIHQRQSPTYAAYFESRAMSKDTGTGDWRSISWLPDRPVGKELPNYGAIETGYPSGNVSMSGNVLLMHLNEAHIPIIDTSGKWNHAFCFIDCPLMGVSGRFHRALQFDGNDDYLIANSVNEFPATEITAMFWMRSVNTTKAATLFSYAVSDSKHNELLIYDDRDFRVVIGNRSSFPTGVSANDGQWHHIAVTWQSFDGRLDIYRDGQLENTQTLQQGYAFIGGGVLVLGQDQDELGGGFNPNQAFQGDLDEVSIFNRTLTGGEILDHYLRGALRVQFQARTCDDDKCTGPDEWFVGPDGARTSYYSALTNPSLSPPTLALADAGRDHIQYRAYLDTYNIDDSPALRQVEIVPSFNCAGTYTVTCELAPMPSGALIAFEIPVTVTTSVYTSATIVNGKLTLINTAIVDGDESDHFPDDNVISIGTPLRFIPLTSVSINGPATGLLNTFYPFIATVKPDNATPPVTYTWEATGQTTQQHVAWLSDTVVFTWDTTGSKTVTVWATNDGATVVSDTSTINIENPAPVLVSIDPAIATAGGLTFTLTVNGNSFVNGSIVRWNGSDRVTSFVNSTQLTAIIPDSDIVVTGTANITVFNPGPGGGTSSPQVFTISSTMLASSSQRGITTAMTTLPEEIVEILDRDMMLTRIRSLCLQDCRVYADRDKKDHKAH